MSATNIAELPAEVRAKVMAQLAVQSESENVSLAEMPSDVLVNHIVDTLGAALTTRG